MRDHEAEALLLEIAKRAFEATAALRRADRRERKPLLIGGHKVGVLLGPKFRGRASDRNRDLWALVRECKNLNFIFVTKRIGNAGDMLPEDWAENFGHCGIVATVVTQFECDRDLPKLLRLKERCGVAWVGLSIEPQLERVIPKDAEGLDWIITGGESDQGGALGRRYLAEWAIDLILWGEAHGVAIFVKQLGSHWSRTNHARERSGAEPMEWSPNLRVRHKPRGVALLRHAPYFPRCILGCPPSARMT
jgi:hypothetical protein